jgi:acyl-coenzyme A thioesterase PaaI-like protein
MITKEMPNADHAHFAAIPWCIPHLQGDRTVARPLLSRTLKPTDEDSLFAETLKSERGIVHMLEIYEKPTSPAQRVDEVKAFLTLGRGLNGHPNICHGGLVTTILDEVVGLLISINQERATIPTGSYVTAYLNTSFVKPVPTPATLLARAWFTKFAGRK